MPEHAPMLTSTVARRGASLTGGCVNAEKGDAMAGEVVVSTRCGLLLSRASFHITTRPLRPLGDPPRARHHPSPHLARFKRESVEPAPGCR